MTSDWTDGGDAVALVQHARGDVHRDTELHFEEAHVIYWQRTRGRRYSTSRAPADPPAPGTERNLPGLLLLLTCSCVVDGLVGLPSHLLGIRTADATHDAKAVARLPNLPSCCAAWASSTRRRASLPPCAG